MVKLELGRYEHRVLSFCIEPCEHEGFVQGVVIVTPIMPVGVS